MAKKIDPVKFLALLDELSSEDLPFKDLFEKAGGFDAKRIKTEERYAPTRQLNTEFANCSKLASLLKRQLGDYLQTIPDRYVNGHIVKLLTTLKNFDTNSPKGQRTITKGLQTDAAKKLLDRFSFNQKSGLPSTAYSNTTLDLDKGTFAFRNLVVNHFYMAKGIKAVAFQLILLRIDPEGVTSQMAVSDQLALPAGEEKHVVQLEAAVPEGDGLLLAVLYVGFGSVSNGTFRVRKGWANGLGVVGFEV